MKTLTLRLMAAAILIGWTGYCLALPEAQQAPPALGSMTVAELEKAGDASRSVKDYDQAIKYFRAALIKEPKNASLYNKLGMAELKQNDLRAARIDFGKAAKYDRKYAEALNNIGALEYMQHNLGAAAKYFKKALALDETSAVFHINLGATWFAQKKLDRAIAEYTRALELDPEALAQNAKAGMTAQISSSEDRARYSYMLAKVYAKRGDIDRCLQCLRSAKQDGFRDLKNVYKEEEFSRLRQDPRLAEAIGEPARQ